MHFGDLQRNKYLRTKILNQEIIIIYVGENNNKKATKAVGRLEDKIERELDKELDRNENGQADR